MCGRYTMTHGQAEQPADYEPRYNIAPRQRQQTVRTEFEEREAALELPQNPSLSSIWHPGTLVL